MMNGGKKKDANSQENVSDILLGRVSSGFLFPTFQ